MLKVYLSGGMRSGWQDEIIAACLDRDVEWIDPRNNDTKDPSLYTPWDLFGVQQSDVVFAYLESDNPAGQGLAVEVGYAKGLGKHVICYIENREDARYWEIVAHTADVSAYSKEEALNYLRSLLPYATKKTGRVSFNPYRREDEE